MPAPYFNLSYKQHAVWLLSWPPPWRGKPVPESFRENGPNSRTSGTARDQIGLLGSLRRGSRRATQTSVQDQKDPGQAPNCTKLSYFQEVCQLASAIQSQVPAFSDFLLSQALENLAEVYQRQDYGCGCRWGDGVM